MARRLSLINLFALLITLAVNFLSNIRAVNGETVATVSARYPTMITPAPYAFGIWILIYLMLASFTVSHLFLTSQRQTSLMQVGGWFLASCAANCGWVFAWLYGMIGLSVLLMLTLLFCLIKIVQRTGMEMSDATPSTIVFLWWPFCIYLGWIVLAALVNIAAWLVKIEWKGWGIAGNVWATIMIVAAGTIYLFLTWRRNMREAAMPGVWGLTAVGVAARTHLAGVSTIAWVVAAVVFCSAMIHAYRNRELRPFRKR